MKKYQVIFSIACLLIPACFVCAHETANSLQAQDRVENPDFMVESRGKKIELIPNSRAHITNKHGQLDRTTSSTDDVFTPKNLGILFDHNSGIEIATTGEITFKLKPGISPEAVQTLLLPNVSLVMKPDIYLIKTSTPRQLVKILRQLNASTLIDWAEPFKVPSKIN